MERLFGVSRQYLPHAVEKIKSKEAERGESTATLIIIDDVKNKADALEEGVMGKSIITDTPKLPITVYRASSAGEGLALVKMFLTHQDMQKEEAEKRREQFVTHPLIIAMDNMLPFRKGIREELHTGMGFLAAQAIIDFCIGKGEEKEGGEEFPLPFFIGFSEDHEPNKQLEQKLRDIGAANNYRGSFWLEERHVMGKLQDISTRKLS